VKLEVEMAERERQRLELIEFLRTIQRPDYPLDGIDEESSLVESGLIDSLALLQIVTYLEQSYHIDFNERGIDPEDLRSVNSILELIARDSAS
jgi:acyl carrier protein